MLSVQNYASQNYSEIVSLPNLAMHCKTIWVWTYISTYLQPWHQLETSGQLHASAIFSTGPESAVIIK
jgi:hypothetical protein